MVPRDEGREWRGVLARRGDPLRGRRPARSEESFLGVDVRRGHRVGSERR